MLCALAVVANSAGHALCSPTRRVCRLTGFARARDSQRCSRALVPLAPRARPFPLPLLRLSVVPLVARAVAGA